MGYKNVLIEFDDDWGTIIINRPKKLNALNKETIAELHKAFEELNDDDEVRVIIITGSGDRAFVAGADIAEFSDFDKGQGKKFGSKQRKRKYDRRV